jgi:hypothetical protein
MKITSSTLALILLAPVIFSGCATITKDANQSVQIETYSKDNQPVAGVKCTAQNERGQWTTTSPGAVNVHRSGQNLLINCEKEGEQAGRGTAVSRANGGMFGNIVFGGGIGAIIDHNKGTAYTYPSWLRIVMGDSLVYDRRDEKENTPMTGTNVSPEKTAGSTTTATAAATTNP